jgi:myo-inositol-1(or 4)-monophosphatase
MSDTTPGCGERGEGEAADCLATLHRLADLSAAAILPHFRAEVVVEEKAERGYYDPVTVADRAAEAVMRAHVEAQFPAHGIIGEEFGSRNEGAALTWIFDPIDGTRAFIIGAPTWGTLIGLSRGGRPHLGLMNQPYTRERFWGGPQGAFFRGPDGGERRLRTAATAELATAILASTAPDYFKGRDAELFFDLTRQVRMTRYGYDCYAYCLLAMGRIDLVAECSLASYDIAPLIPIVEAAGGIVTTWQGGDAAQGGEILASANPALHDQALKVLG